MSLEEVLDFVRSVDSETWRVIVNEMGITRKRRNEYAARQFSVGNLVLFQPPEKDQSFKGRILTINRRGRVVLEVLDGAHQHQEISVPAGLLLRCS
jgi:hypothetical protein